MNNSAIHRTPEQGPIVLMLRVTNARSSLVLNHHEVPLTPFQHAILFTLALRRGQFHAQAWLEQDVYGRPNAFAGRRLAEDVAELRRSVTLVCGEDPIHHDPALGYALSNRVSIEIEKA